MLRLLSTEFFLRQIYKCTAQAASDATLFEVSFVHFWEVVERHRLEDTFTQQLQMQGAWGGGVGVGDELVRDSTSQLVEKFHKNLNKNSKMSQMMRVSSLHRLGLADDDHYVVLPDSVFHHCWAMASIGCIAYIALTVPYFVAFRNMNMAIAVCDALLCVFFGADMFLRLRHFAVLEDGALLRNREHFGSLYWDFSLKWDLVSTLPIALILLGECHEAEGEEAMHSV